MREMNAEIISIGSEVLSGDIHNTNATFISRYLKGFGINVNYHTVVGDVKLALASVFRQALARSDIIISTGGLGPTIDDITKDAISEVTNRDLILKRDILLSLKERFKKRDIKMPECNKRQAYIPQGSIVIDNKVGTAPGLIMEMGNKSLICLPGVPREALSMLEEDVEKYLKKRVPKGYIIYSNVVKTVGLMEAEVNERLQDLFNMRSEAEPGGTRRSRSSVKILQRRRRVEVGIYAHQREIDIKLTIKAKNKREAEKSLRPFLHEIKRSLGRAAFGEDEDTLEEVVGRLLKKNNKTISIAESCTGGLASSRFTDVPGSSIYFKSAMVAYSNEAKISELDIPQDVIKKCGAVSKEVSLLMASSIRKIMGADIGLGITGIAGPGGGTKKKPVGLVHIALDSKNKRMHEVFHFSGARKDIKSKASTAALDMARRYFSVRSWPGI